tara:strand:- start:2606 stop:3400 length:795 start_codon:yes stop_codon:yes gene_type:complete
MDEMIDDSIKNNSATIIQKHIRGYLDRMNLLKLKDGMTYSCLEEYINKYNDNLDFIEKMNQRMKHKKIRNPNFPSEISENIAKFAICKKYKIMPNWDCKGDLIMLNKKIEVKGFMARAPSSFGPKEPWDFIYFVDAINTLQKNYKVFEIKLSNISEDWRNIVISGKDKECEDCDIPNNLESLKKKELTELCKGRGLKLSGNKGELIQRINNEEVGSGLNPKLTYGDIADADKRGKLRAPFYEIIKPQIEDYCNLIFEGHINELI